MPIPLLCMCDYGLSVHRKVLAATTILRPFCTLCIVCNSFYLTDCCLLLMVKGVDCLPAFSLLHFFVYFCVVFVLVSKVLAATSLRPTDLQGYSDPYCVCYLKIPDSTAGGSGATDDRFQGQRGETYFCEKTLNPKWSGQRFIFKVWDVVNGMGLEDMRYDRMGCCGMG